MRRILKSKSLYICSVISILWIIIRLLEEMANQGENAAAYVSGVRMAMESGLFALLTVLPVFFAVFSHELSSKSMQCVLGHGLSRDKLIVTKLIDAAVLLIGMFLIFTVCVCIFADSSYGISDNQIKQLVIYVWLRGLVFFGYVTFSAMVMFLANSVAAGVTTSLVLSFILTVIIALIENFTGVSLKDYTLDGLVSWAYDAIKAGALPWQLIPAFGYIAASVIVTVIFFRRKEFEF